MERQNRRLLANLTAWAEILDALGWSVALGLPGREPLLSANAQKWLGEQAGMTPGWEGILARLAADPPSRQLVGSLHLQVWAATEAAGDPLATAESLTKREGEVLGWLREGKTGPEIAIILGCALRTVESHVGRIYRKMGLHNRSQLHFKTAPPVP